MVSWSSLLEKVDIPIGLPVGPEVLEGSTRLKAGTAQKMVLNMLSTASMVQFGKVYQNLMVDVKPKNRKLLNRAKNIVMKLTDVGEAEAKKYLKDSGNDVKVAIVMARKQLDQETARNFLNHHHGYLGKILNEIWYFYFFLTGQTSHLIQKNESFVFDKKTTLLLDLRSPSF